ncbi:uncharacterized protein LOC109253667 [Panthera pardus]|uniref:Uncharacterized protein LOC109253667 n=1 Tax=Panthera pardus TaxID=9691 RepID=A0A9V1EID8_PANPR|nr:uncharacterized protein LOC109253667 [Panthera pardus]
MEKDILTYMEPPMTQACDTDPATVAAPARAPPGLQTPLEGAVSAASSGVHVGQESMEPGEYDEVEKMSVLSLGPSAEADAPHAGEVPGHAALQGTSSQGNTGKKTSRKRRNRKENKVVYLPWPLTLQTRASSAAPVLGQTRVTGALPIADTGVGAVYENREEREWDDKEKVPIATWPEKAHAGAPLPAESTAQASLEEASVAANEEIKGDQTGSHKGRNKKNKKVMASPWPLTVQAWVSFTGPGQMQMATAGASSFASDGVNAGPKSKGQKGEANKTSAGTPYQSAQDGAPGSAEGLGQASWEGASPPADSPENEEKRTAYKRRNRKERSVSAGPWPLTVQAWVSFATADQVQTRPQGESSVASMGVNVGPRNWPQTEYSEEGAQAALPWPERVQAGAPFPATAPGQVLLQGHPSQDLHSKVRQMCWRPQGREGELVPSNPEQVREPCQGCRRTERHLRDQDFWECTVMNFARQVDCCYCGELCSQQRMEALTLTKAHTHISTSVMGPEKERAKSQAVWMEKWGGF